MPTKATREPTDTSKTLKTAGLIPAQKRGPGRPQLPQNATPPQFTFLSEYERDLYDLYTRALEADYPGMKPSDRMLLPLVAGEFIKCMRLLGNELSSGELVTMSRQHPGTQFRSLLDQILGATRKSRVKNGDDKKDDIIDALPDWMVKAS